MDPGTVIATYHVISSIVNAVTSTANSALSRKQQEKLATQSRDINREMEENRQHFQLEMHELNTQKQRELNQQSHAFRLAEQRNAFENACKQAEWNQFLAHWPLVNYPSVIREQQILPDNTVSLRVIFAKSADQDFHKYIYPHVEQGLRDFVDLYHNVFNSRNIIFYHNAFLSNVSGGAVEANIHYGLKELPVIIIGTNVLLNQVDVSLTMWGLGDSRSYPDHMSIFKTPYQRVPDIKYYEQLASKILQYLKFIIGFAYDTYNLTEYNRMPLLPTVAKYELECNFPDAILGAEELQLIMGRKYNEIYSGVIGSIPSETTGTETALLPYHTKSTELHKLRLGYAKAVRECADKTMYVKYLDESLDAWVSLRSVVSTNEFLSKILSNPEQIAQYVGLDDKDYIVELAEEYTASAVNSLYASNIKKLAQMSQSFATKPLRKNKTIAYQQDRSVPKNGEITTDNPRKLIKF